jgi:hypothetical protein
MRVEEGLSFFDCCVTLKCPIVRDFLGHVTKGLDTILATENLFKGTVVDFESDLQGGGGSFANNSFAIT